MNNSSSLDDAFESVNHVITIVEVLIFIVSVLGNALVILTVIRVYELRTTLNLLVVNLSVCDILIVTFGIPFSIAEEFHQELGYLYGDFGCRVINPLATLGSNSAAFALLCIAIERYVAIKHPMRWTGSKNHAFKFIVLTYVYGVITVIPYSYHQEVVYSKGLPECNETWSDKASQAYTIFLFLIQYGLPLPVMMTLYAKAWFYLKEQNEHAIKLSEAQRKSRGASMISQDQITSLRARLNHKERASSVVSTASSYTQEVKHMCLINCLPSKLYAILKGKHRGPHLKSSVQSEQFIANGRRRQTIRTFLMFVLIMVIFAVCMLPNQITWLFKAFVSETKLPKYTENIFYMLHYTNCVLNPLIYGGLNKVFRRACKKALCCENTDLIKTEEQKESIMPSDENLFKDGIIIRSPVQFINCGSVDSIFDDVGVSEQEVKKQRRVKFKFSTASSFGSKSFGSRTISNKSMDKEMRKMSVSLVTNRQRKLTLPNLSPTVNSQGPIRKYSVPLLAAATISPFDCDDSLTLLPPTVEPTKSSSTNGLLSKLSMPSRRKRKVAINQPKPFNEISIYGELQRPTANSNRNTSVPVCLETDDTGRITELSFRESDDDQEGRASTTSTSESICDDLNNFSNLRINQDLKNKYKTDESSISGSESSSDLDGDHEIEDELNVSSENRTSIREKNNPPKCENKYNNGQGNGTKKNAFFNIDYHDLPQITETDTTSTSDSLIDESDSGACSANVGISWQKRILSSCECPETDLSEQFMKIDFDFSKLKDVRESCI